MELCIKFDFFSEGRQVVTCNLMYICIGCKPRSRSFDQSAWLWYEHVWHMYDIYEPQMFKKVSLFNWSSQFCAQRNAQRHKVFCTKIRGAFPLLGKHATRDILTRIRAVWSNQHLWSVDRSWSKTYHTTQWALFVSVCLWSLFCVTVPKWRHCIDRETVETHAWSHCPSALLPWNSHKDFWSEVCQCLPHLVVLRSIEIWQTHHYSPMIAGAGMLEIYNKTTPPKKIGL